VRVLPWEKGQIKAERLAALYVKLRSVRKVQEHFAAKGLRVGRSTMHVWLRTAGVELRHKGNDGTRRKAKPAKVVRFKPAQVVGSSPCPQGRHWSGVVVLCAFVLDNACGECTRGYEHSVREVMTAGCDGQLGTHAGRRRGRVGGGSE
jgi:hypothetical protein